MRHQSNTQVSTIVGTVFLSILGPVTAIWAAGDSRVVFSDWQEPHVVRSMDGLQGSVRVESGDPIESAVVEYRYSKGTRGEVAAYVDPEDAGLLRFEIPPDADAGLGELDYSVHLLFSLGEKALRSVSSETRRLPVAHAEELDITGEAAVALLYPLLDDAYTVRYVPCCNIYGGITYGVRSHANPEGVDKGLPPKLASDFVVIEPDGLSASTMGLYFVFTYDAKKVGDAGPVLYEFNGVDAWGEAVDYEVDAGNHTLLVHSPDGGTYVLGSN